MKIEAPLSGARFGATVRLSGIGEALSNPGALPKALADANGLLLLPGLGEINAEPEKLVRKARAAGKFWVDRERPLSFERYATTDRPVRVWTNFAEVDVMRGAVSADGLGNDLLMFTTSSAGSRVRTSVVGVIQDQFVVVDRRRMGGRKLGGLADYVALAGVASARADRDYEGFNTVLNLFTEEGRTDASPMDRAYLRGLQTVKPDSPGGSQIGQVVTAMRAERDGRAKP